MSDHLRSIYDRWHRLEEEKQAISDDLKELFLEAKGNGYNPKALREAFRLKAMSGEENTKRDEHEALVDLYLAGLSGTNSAPRAQAHVARLTPLVPEQKATPGNIAEPAPRQEQAGTHPPMAPAAPVPEATEPRADTRTAARGNSSDDDWPEMPAFLVRTEQGRG